MLHGVQHVPGDKPFNGSPVNGINGSASPASTLTRTVALDTLPESSVLLAWLLLLGRLNAECGESESVGRHFVWGRLAPDGTDSPLPVPEAELPSLLAPSQTIAGAVDGIGKLLPRTAALAGGRTLFFSGAEETSTQFFRLQVAALQDGQQLALFAQWRLEALSEPTVARHLDVLADLLRLVASRSDATVSEATAQPLPSDLARIWAWNATVPPTVNQCVHDMVSDAAARHPDAPAVSAWDGELSYGQVEHASNRLARRLAAEGVQVGGAPVPLCFEKSRWTAVAVLAVMKAGAAFCLTDPSQPAARLRAMAEQTGAGVVVTSQQQEERGREMGGEKVVVVSDWVLESDEAEERKELAPVPPSSPMYVIFTSGSTGRPKGVVVSHANYASGMVPRAQAVGYGPGVRVFEFASYAFDVSIDCMLCTLATGGCVCVPSDTERVDDLGGALRRSGAAMAHMTPSVARVLDADVLAALDVLGLGGEAVSSRDAAVWSARGTRVVIAYGPSECTVGCTIGVAGGATSSSNIGKGVGAVTWLVDPSDHHLLVPVGAVGELLVEGPVVGLGYLGEPDKTAEVFVEDPAWLVARGRRGRLYKTGDLVRYDSDGSGALVFVGRKDQQVKIRGQRVELVEIEHHLRQELARLGELNPKMVAEVITPGEGDPTLVVFVEEDGESLSSLLPSLDAALADALPRYMVPTAYIPLARIPALVSGKTDRKRLRALGAAMSRQQVAGFRVVGDRRRPQTDTEHTLHRLWTALLGGESITLGDSFFALGGDSLKAMRLVAAARDEGLRLTVAQVFMHPTLGEMAAVTTKETESLAESLAPFSLLSSVSVSSLATLCSLDPSHIDDAYPCTPLQEALMALSAKIDEAYVAQRVLRLPDADTLCRLQAAFDAASDQCAVLRTRIVQAPGHGLVQVVVRGAIPWRTSNSLQDYLDADRREPMALGRPLVRYGVVHKSEKVFLVLTIHHSLYDGWSMPLVIDRVNRAYNGLPPPSRAPFSHFIRFLSAQDRAACDEFWRDRLCGATGRQFPALPWPGYQARADSLLEHFVSIDRRPASSTLATVVRAAWALVAACFASCPDVVFGETLTGRNAPVAGAAEIEGPMITTVPVRVAVDHSLSVNQFLAGVQDAAVAQMPYEHAGLQNIRRLGPDALHACELRTGLVLHPGEEEEKRESESPADGLVPAGDAEAAQEALKFNTYALMLVCSLSPRGIFVMASFDSRTVDEDAMRDVLRHFDRAARRLCSEPEDTLLSVVDFLEPGDVDESWRVGKNPKLEALGDRFQDITGAWIVDPADPSRLLPRGAIGELLVQSTGSLDLAVVDPEWLREKEGRLFQTGLLASMLPDGSVVRHGSRDEDKKKVVQAKQHPALSAASAKQKKLRSLWARVLRADEDAIGLGDSFFRLGGDSISAMKLVSEARLDGFELSVSRVFAHRSLFDMAAVMTAVEGSSENSNTNSQTYEPFSLIDDPSFVDHIRPLLVDPAWPIVDVLPARPLQEIALRGTVALPRYSVRYEMLHFDSPVDPDRLLVACRDLVARNEILRTVFVEARAAVWAVVIENLPVDIARFEVESGAAAFAARVCEVDVQSDELSRSGAPLVKFFFVSGHDGSSTLVFRLSHAQYDEICLPVLLRQLSAVFEGRPVPRAVPFSRFVDHVVRRALPPSLDYWRRLLDGCGGGPTPFSPAADVPVVSRRHYAVDRAVNVAARSRDITLATLPTAAWALCLARRLGRRDVVFGEVVSGRSLDDVSAGLDGSDIVTGPCWQYVPVRVRLEPGQTGADLLEAVQHQHIASSRFEAAALREIAAACGWEQPADVWFDSVVHQDVAHVDQLPFSDARCRAETLYPHQEPLREWKIQAFADGDQLTLEVVTFESWAEQADRLLADVVEALETLVHRPWEPVDV